jgi:DNA polymerase IIIc chi subunit
MVVVMLIARKESEQEPIRQRIKKYKNQAYEFGFAAESAYQWPLPKRATRS